MKDRIREFARVSHLDVYGLGKDREKWEAVLSEYTKLVVQECIGVVEGGRFLHDEAPTAIFARECSSAIKRHFGINGHITYKGRGLAEGTPDDFHQAAETFKNVDIEAALRKMNGPV